MKEQPKIALIGPLAPYRGGISLYTTELYKAMGQTGDVYVVSFYRQYPKFLYPGKTEILKVSDNNKLPGVDYILDYANPLSWRKTAREIIKNDCDVAIFDWWTLFWQPMFVFVAHQLKREGIKVIFLCHNVLDHDKKWSSKSASKLLIKSADGYISHAKEQVEILRSIVPNSPILRRAHPIYNHYPAPNKKLQKRGRLEILFFGFIRPYKGLDTLVESLAILNDKDVYLTVVGEAWEDDKRLESRLGSIGAPNLELVLEYVDDQEAANYFSRADIVALPYESATGSGVATLAYHYKKPILATNVGGLKDTVIDGETGWLVNPGSPDELAKAIKEIYKKNLPMMQSAIEEFCKENSWEQMAKEIYRFANSLK